IFRINPPQELCHLIGATAERRHAVVDPVLLPKALQESGVAKKLEVSRDSRLTLPEHASDLTDRELASSADAEDPEARRLGGFAQTTDDLRKEALCQTAL